MLLECVRRRVRAERVSRRHPTTQEAFDALSEGRCLYAAPGRNCSSKPRSTGLRDDLDDSNILVCRGHYGALRNMEARRLDELEQGLIQAFAETGRFR